MDIEVEVNKYCQYYMEEFFDKYISKELIILLNNNHLNFIEGNIYYENKIKHTPFYSHIDCVMYEKRFAGDN